MTIFDITDDVQAYLALIEEQGGEITEENATAVEAWEAEFVKNLAAKADNYILAMAKLDAMASVAGSQKDQFAKAEKVQLNTIRTMKARLLWAMQTTGQAKIVTPLMRTLAIVNNGGSIPVQIDDSFPLQDIADEFKESKTVITVNKDKVRAALEAGRELPFARLGERGQRLAIK